MDALKGIIIEGQKKGLIKISNDFSTITYLNQNISRNYNNPEERVQAETFCELVLKYNYPVENIRLYVKVTVGSDVKEADIIVYNDSTCKRPHIIVECKKEEQFAKRMPMLLLLQEQLNIYGLLQALKMNITLLIKKWIAEKV